MPAAGSCCEGCFEDPWLRRAIATRGVVGSCDFCGNSNVPYVNVRDLAKEFEPLLTYYVPYDPEKHRGILALLREALPPYVGALANILDDDWDLFSKRLTTDERKRLLAVILSCTSAPERAPIDSNWIPVDAEFGYKSLLSKWQDFAFHLRSERRFLPATGKPDMKEAIQKALNLVDSTISAGTSVFRARKGYEFPSKLPTLFAEIQPLPLERMGVPPREKVLSSQRINPPGIPFLYLARDRDTAVSEKRPSKGDILTVARYELSRDVRVASLVGVADRFSPFSCEDILAELENRKLLRALSYQFSQPIDPDRAPVDYVPTQYAAEVIRDAGFRGIEYQSALGKAPNLVLFDSKDATGMECELVEVRGVHYQVEDHVPMWRQREAELALGWLDRSNRITVRFAEDMIRLLSQRPDNPSVS